MVVAAGRQRYAAGVPIEMYLDPSEAHALTIASYGNDDAIGNPTFPLATLAEARTRMRSILPTQSRTATVRIVDRPTDSVLSLDDNDSGQNGHKVVWFGGDQLRSQADGGVEGHIENRVPVTGWTLFDSENDIWSAPFDGHFIRSIWVDGVRRYRCRRGSGLIGGASWTSTGYSAAGDAILTESNYADVVLLYNDLTQNFNEPHNRVSGVAGSAISMIDPAHTYITVFPGLSRVGWTVGYATEEMPVDVEGCWADFGTPGTFYFDTDTLYYIPDGEDLSTAEVLVPGTAETICEVNGASDIDLTRLGFFGGGFSMTEGFAERYAGVGYDSTHIPSDGGGGNYGPDGGNLTLLVFPAAVKIINCTRVNLIEPRIKHHECHGLHRYGNTDCQVTGALFDDIGSSGMTVGDYTELEAVTCTDGDLQENIIAARCGVMYRGGIGINDALMTRSTLHKVLVYDCPYVGINLSYGHTWDESWDTKIEENVVRYLRLHDCMTTLADGAAIGSSGNKRGLVIEYFYVSDIRDGDTSIPGLPRGGAMLDDTSTNQTVRFGVIDNCLHTIICNNPANPNTLVVTDIHADRDADLISTIPPNDYEIIVTADPTTGPGAAIIAVAKPDDYYLNIYAGELP